MPSSELFTIPKLSPPHISRSTSVLKNETRGVDRAIPFRPQYDEERKTSAVHTSRIEANNIELRSQNYTEEIGNRSTEKVNTTSTWTAWVEEDRPTVELRVWRNESGFTNECNNGLLAFRVGVVEGNLRGKQVRSAMPRKLSEVMVTHDEARALAS